MAKWQKGLMGLGWLALGSSLGCSVEPPLFPAEVPRVLRSVELRMRFDTALTQAKRGVAAVELGSEAVVRIGSSSSPYPGSWQLTQQSDAGIASVRSTLRGVPVSSVDFIPVLHRVALPGYICAEAMVVPPLGPRKGVPLVRALTSQCQAFPAGLEQLGFEQGRRIVDALPDGASPSIELVFDTIAASNVIDFPELFEDFLLEPSL